MFSFSSKSLNIAWDSFGITCISGFSNFLIVFLNVEETNSKKCRKANVSLILKPFWMILGTFSFESKYYFKPAHISIARLIAGFKASHMVEL